MRNRPAGRPGAVLAVIAGCRVHVDKDANGEDKNVQVDTPFGGVHVNTNQTTAADLGLPVYPGAQTVSDDDKRQVSRRAPGLWRVGTAGTAVSYATSRQQDKVLAFYKKALGRYGDVITCQGNTPVGTPTTTSEGLSCADDKGNNIQIDRGDYGSSKTAWN